MPEQEDLSCCIDKVRDSLVRGQGSKLLAPGGGGEVFWWHSNVLAKYSSLLALLLCWHLDLGAKAKRRDKHQSCAWKVWCSRFVYCQPPLHTLQESLEGAQVGLFVHVCMFSCVLSAQKGGPTSGKEDVCVVLGRNCVGPGMWMRPHTPTRCPVELVSR